MKSMVLFIFVSASLSFATRYYDPEVGMWISVDPVGQHFSPYTYGNVNPVNRVDPNGAADYGTQDNYVKVATNVINDDAYLSLDINGDGKNLITQCNIATMAIVNTGLQLQISGTANEIALDLTDQTFAKQITPDQAVTYAKLGLTPIVAWYNPNGGHGHVATVAPSFDANGRPNVFNVGDDNGLMSVAAAFSGVKRNDAQNFGYYILQEDLISLSNRPKTGN